MAKWRHGHHLSSENGNTESGVSRNQQLNIARNGGKSQWPAKMSVSEISWQHQLQ